MSSFKGGIIINTENGIERISAELEKMGFTIATHYICANTPNQEGETAIIVGYVRKTACIMCAEVYHTFTRYYVTFTICGQLKEKGYPKARLHIRNHDCFCESDSENGGFTRQFRLKNNDVLEEQINAGIEFFRDFLEHNLVKFASRFIEVPFLAIAPVQTQEYNLAAQSLSRTGPQEYFEKKVLPLLPTDIMPIKTCPLITV